MAKKKLFSAVDKPATAALCGEEIDVVDDPSTTPSTSVENEASADAKREPNMEQNESMISYAETRCSIQSEPFR
jgi:hypothetical protein